MTATHSSSLTSILGRNEVGGAPPQATWRRCDSQNTRKCVIHVAFLISRPAKRWERGVAVGRRLGTDRARVAASTNRDILPELLEDSVGRCPPRFHHAWMRPWTAFKKPGAYGYERTCTVGEGGQAFSQGDKPP